MSGNDFFDTAGAAEYIGYSQSWLEKNHGPRGLGPRPVQYRKGAKARYRKSSLDEWLEQHG